MDISISDEEKQIIKDSLELYLKAISMLDEDNFDKIQKAYNLMNKLER